MAKPGPKAKPYLAAVREGNPGKRTPKKGAVVAADGLLAEPDWREVFPFPRSGSVASKLYRGDITRARNVARAEWRRIVPTLMKSVGLVHVDLSLVKDYCVCVARIDQGERALSREGMLMLGERGMQKNGWTTILGQYRTQLKSYIGELGLSPSSRTGIDPASDDDDGQDAAFD